MSGVRWFLRKFRLPGEAQLIDRIMESFAKGYYEGNQGAYSGEAILLI